MKDYFTSRSAIECLDACDARWYWEYAHEGKGIRPDWANVPLTTGTAVHTGIGFLMNCLKLGQALDPDRVMEAVRLAQAKYEEIVKGQYKNTKSAYGNEYTYQEQSHLTAALVILWVLDEGKNLPKEYEVVEVEKEENIKIWESIYTGEDEQIKVILESRADALLKSKNAKKDFLVYSLKTAKRWYKNQRESLKHDLQGITETLAIKDRWEKEDWHKKAMLLEAESAGFNEKTLDSLRNGCLGASGKNLIGVRYCILVKGDYKEPWEGADFKVTHNPLIRGYKKIGKESKEYAHSWYFPNPQNKSGKGALGGGWEAFNTWREEGIDPSEWVLDCWNGKIQGVAQKNIQELVNVMEVYRDRKDIERTKQELVTILSDRRLYMAIDGKITPEELPHFFPRRRRSCHNQGDCDYIKICHENENPEIGNGWKYREPHHELEKESQE